ncbi:MAG TPA: hypothetical protein VI893_08180 [Thermoplasmata archaeon]|nr:hypothetical protein [Thermoplasmata archaeon]
MTLTLRPILVAVMLASVFSLFSAVAPPAAPGHRAESSMESSVNAAPPAPEPQMHCQEEKEAGGQKLKGCWEHPVTVQVLFHVFDQVHETIFVDFTEGGKFPEAVPVEFLSTADPHVPGSIWENDTANGTWKKLTYLNQSGGASTGKFYRIPDPDTGYTNLTKYTFFITVLFQATVEHRDGTNQTTFAIDSRIVDIPNDNTTDNCRKRPNPEDPLDCDTKYAFEFHFYYNYSIIDFPYVEAVDGNYLPTMAVGLIGFTAPSAFLAGRHFMRKREVEEEKRREKETRFKV